MRVGWTTGIVLSVSALCLAGPFMAEVAPSADAFTRSMAPDENYGKAGGLSVSGAAAVNGQGQQMGMLDTFLRFDLAQFAADAQFAAERWIVTEAVLSLPEQGAPNNPIFNRGIGQFEIRWIADDGWREGTGSPKKPTDDGVAFADQFSILDPAADLTLGRYENQGIDVAIDHELPLPQPLVDDILAGEEVSLFLTAADEAVGFTFNSRNIKPPSPPPVLRVTANIPEPATLVLLAAGLCGVLARNRTRRR